MATAQDSIGHCHIGEALSGLERHSLPDLALALTDPDAGAYGFASVNVNLQDSLAVPPQDHGPGDSRVKLGVGQDGGVDRFVAGEFDQAPGGLALTSQPGLQVAMKLE